MAKTRGLFDDDYGLGNGDPYGTKEPTYLTAEDSWGRSRKTGKPATRLSDHAADKDKKDKDKKDKDWVWGSFERCYQKHLPLKIGEHVIYGGSCISPAIKDADVYVGFDSGIRRSPMAYPWTPGTEFLYRIQDMAAPEDAKSFVQLIAYLAEQLQVGKKVHCGCIGGHGRTGTVFAALVTHMTGEKDSITYVRQHYCKKAVESSDQVAFLHKHFGITTVDGYKKQLNSLTGSSKTASLPATRTTSSKGTAYPIPDAKLALW